jgi:hypothetical protein
VDETAQKAGEFLAGLATFLAVFGGVLSARFAEEIVARVPAG